MKKAVILVVFLLSSSLFAVDLMTEATMGIA